MKKIILLMLLIPNIVIANTVYTEYEPFILNTTEYLEETEIIKREEVKLYNTYSEELEEKYLTIEDANQEYQIDYNDVIYEEKNSLEHSEYAYDYQTKCFNENYYTNKIFISDFSDNLIISEAKILSNRLKGVGINIENFGGFLPHIANNNLTDIIKLNSDSILSFNLFGSTAIDDLTIKVYLPKQDLDKISFKVKLSNKELTSEVILPANVDNVITIHFDNNFYNFLKENNFSTNNTCISYYSLKIPLYKHSKINKIKLNNYISLNNKDLFLMNDYKTTYNYYKREKIEVEDNYLLNNKEFDINEYIKSSTIPLRELNIIHNINYKKAGIYNIDIYYQNNLLISKKIEYRIDTIDNFIIEPTTEKNTTKIYNKKVFKQTITKKHTIYKTTNTRTKNVNQTHKTVKSVKENKYEKSILITVISSLLIFLITFECILLYVNKKYY